MPSTVANAPRTTMQIPNAPPPDTPIRMVTTPTTAATVMYERSVP